MRDNECGRPTHRHRQTSLSEVVNGEIIKICDRSTDAVKSAPDWLTSDAEQTPL